MKKGITILTILLLTATSIMAQNPRAVIKSIMEQDRVKAVERLDKISLKTRNEMPEMCILAEAMLLCMPEQSVESCMRGYEMLTQHLNTISSSENIEKVFKGSDTTLSDVVRYIERNSWSAVAKVNNETTYREYLNTAKRGGHTDLSSIMQQLEDLLYTTLLTKQDEALCKEFLAEFPNSQYRNKVELHRTGIRYNEAMRSTDEQLMVQFIAEFPSYERSADVEKRLMEHRYKRVSRSNDLEQMRWFADLYPNYRDIGQLKQQMANIEYPTLEDSKAALEAFSAYYPNVRQMGEVRSRLAVFQIIERGNIGEIFSYIKQNGYNTNYTRLQRAIAQKHGYIILSNDITRLSLIRFRTREGKIGYLNHDGAVVVAPQYELATYNGAAHSGNNATEEFECLESRGIAIVIRGGKYGVINSTGALIIPTEYQSISLQDSQIICVTGSKRDDTEWHNTTYLCNIYDYKGGLVAEGREITIGTDTSQYHNWDTSWFTANVTLKDTHDSEWKKNIFVDGKLIGTAIGGFHNLTNDYRWFKSENDERMHVLSRRCELTTLNFQSYDIEIIYGNIIMAESISTGNRCVVDLDKRSIVSKDKFRDMYPISDGVIAVQYIDNTFGYVDRSLNPVINERYNRAFSFSCGTAAVNKGGVGYLIDKQGKQISATYDDIAPLAGHAGLYKVMKAGKCGIIDANDDIVIEIKYTPKRSTHYTADRLSPVQSIGGEIEWDGGIKTLIFNK